MIHSSDVTLLQVGHRAADSYSLTTSHCSLTTEPLALTADPYLQPLTSDP